MELFLREDFSRLWAGKDPFEQVQKLEGKIYRELEGRRTLRFQLNNKNYFLKLHQGVGWKEIFKNLLQLRLPVLGAENEYKAITTLNKLGVETMTVAAYGRKGINPAKQQSFIITEAIEPSVSLEDEAEKWKIKSPPFLVKLKFIKKVATRASIMHEGGMCHRDFYICHFLLEETSGKLSLIDLHRALIFDVLPDRWRDKDLAALYFSTLKLPFSLKDYLRFLKFYYKKPLRQILSENEKQLAQIFKRANKILSREERA